MNEVNDMNEVNEVNEIIEPKIKAQYKLVAIYYCGKAEGNAEKACVMAGYSEAYSRGNANKIFKREDVKSYIKYLNSLPKDEVIDGVKTHIADVKEIQNFWTHVMNTPSYKIRDRLRASELLAKVQGAFKADDWS